MSLAYFHYIVPVLEELRSAAEVAIEIQKGRPAGAVPATDLPPGKDRIKRNAELLASFKVDFPLKSRFEDLSEICKTDEKEVRREERCIN